MNPDATVNVPYFTPINALFDLKFHQVAIYCDNPSKQIEFWKLNGYTNWHHDDAVLVGEELTPRGDVRTVVKEATMAFNYDIMPLELEYVSYHGQRNLCDFRDGSLPFLSHLSTIVEDVDYQVERLSTELGLTPYHRFTTEQHTNPNVQGKKRFREAIYDMRSRLGFDVKLIQRVPWDFAG